MIQLDDVIAITTGICAAVVIVVLEFLVLNIAMMFIETSDDYLDKKVKERTGEDKPKEQKDKK